MIIMIFYPYNHYDDYDYYDYDYNAVFIVFNIVFNYRIQYLFAVDTNIEYEF